jgi:hypothetical protein
MLLLKFGGRSLRIKNRSQVDYFAITYPFLGSDALIDPAKGQIRQLRQNVDPTLNKPLPNIALGRKSQGPTTLPTQTVNKPACKRKRAAA